MHSKKPLLVLLLLLFASLACYSDSTLWVFGVTDTPPTATFLPQPDEEYPSKVSEDQLALAPQPIAREDPFFFITSLPADLLQGGRNASGSCDFGAELEVLYIGHQWSNFNGSIYADDVTLITGEESEIVFDFESESTWTVVDDGIGADNDNVRLTDNVNFNDLRTADAPDSLNVANETQVLEMRLGFAGEDWSATIFTDFDTPQDWSTQESLTIRLFAPREAEFFFVTPIVRNGDNAEPVELGENALTPGQWTEIEIALTDQNDLTNINGFGFIIGPDPARTWYLIECSGTVGWASEDRIAGPVFFSSGQSALTRAISHMNTPIGPGQPYQIYGGVEPPISTALPPSVTCQTSEVVEILSVSSLDQEIWYEINCSGGSGWVRAFRLFGPLPLPDQGGNGIIRAEFTDGVALTENPGNVSVENAQVGTCAANQVITTIGFDTVETEADRAPFYQITCGDITGWVSQAPLIEIPYQLQTPVIIIGEERTVELGTDDTEAEAEAEVDDTAPQEDEGTEEPDNNYLPVPLADSPAIATSSNTIGECASGEIVRLEDVAGAENLETIFYQVTCNEVTGWVEAQFIPNPVAFEPGINVYFTEANTAPLAPVQGFAIDEFPSQVSPEIGVCELYQPAEVIGVQFELRALARLGFRLYYQLSCLNEDGEAIEGWVELERVNTLSLRDPFEFLGN